MLQVLLIGGDDRHKKMIAKMSGGKAQVIYHWINYKRTQVPAKPFDAIICWTPLCRHSMTAQARKLSGKRAIPLKFVSSRNDLQTYLTLKLEDLKNLSKPDEDTEEKGVSVEMTKPKSQDLKTAVFQCFNRKTGKKGGPSAQLEAIRLQGYFETKYHWTSSATNIARIVRANREDWCLGKNIPNGNPKAAELATQTQVTQSRTEPAEIPLDLTDSLIFEATTPSATSSTSKKTVAKSFIKSNVPTINTDALFNMFEERITCAETELKGVRAGLRLLKDQPRVDPEAESFRAKNIELLARCGDLEAKLELIQEAIKT